ncbi:peptidase M56, BlaR1 [Alkaliphilus metalliredigens QYMF]|uniref:Peptidase M56, BlaR1 n=1 Tax=Alkaliphilus metalliredigens (strain QYMF) TaxID=293826 RepID=A6TUY0_ALKMQ|nr:M56 family metallopeptidase [Alkaliphilus metalliredigens]ABR49998.1 peptidase M56, BlaR1 [Alkaliphilus metalliredigens QYMF]
MQYIFISILNMSIAGSYLIILALIGRFFLRTVPKKYSYILWGIVWFQLIIPFSINFTGVLNFFRGYGINNIFTRPEYIPYSIGRSLSGAETLSVNNPFLTFMLIFLFVVWFIGFAGILLNEAIAYNKARKRLMTAIKIQDNVFETDQITTPLIFGLLNPKVYVPLGITKNEFKYVLCHEQIHIKRKDYLIKFFAYFVLAIHWFNPFVWMAFKYLSNDIEMSCDEKVVATLGSSVRKEYAQTIYNFSKTPIKITRSMLALGESNTRKRVKNVLNKKKNTTIGIVVISIILFTIILLLIFNPSFDSLFRFVENQHSEWEIEGLETTDLSNITVDRIGIGSNIGEIDLSIYQESNRFINREGDYTYYFSELVLDIEDGYVNYIFAFNSEVVINVNNNQSISTIDEVSNLLGDAYLQKTEDGEQRLMKHIYYDREMEVVAEFIYSNYDNQFVWITLRKIQ